MASPHIPPTFIHTCTTVDISVFSSVKFLCPLLIKFAHKRQECKQRIGRAKFLHLDDALDHTSDKVTASIVNCYSKAPTLIFKMQRGDTGGARKDMRSLLHGIRPFSVLCRLSEFFPVMHNT